MKKMLCFLALVAAICGLGSPSMAQTSYEVKSLLGVDESGFQFVTTLVAYYPPSPLSDAVLTGRTHSTIYHYHLNGIDYAFAALANVNNPVYDNATGRYFFKQDLDADAFQSNCPTDYISMDIENTTDAFTQHMSAACRPGILVVHLKSDDGGALIHPVITLHTVDSNPNIYTQVSGKTNCTFGRSGFSGVAPCDAFFPPGLARFDLYFTATADGYASTRSDHITCPELIGKTFTITMAHNSFPASTIAATVPGDNVLTDPAAPSSGTGGSADLGTLNGFVGSFFATLKALLISLFTPVPADVDALRLAASRFMSWGPFGLVADFKRCIDSANFSNTIAQSNGTYWDFPLSIGAFTSSPTPAVPAGYDASAPSGSGMTSNTAHAWARATGQAVSSRYDIAQSQQQYSGLMSGRLRPSAVTSGGTVMDINLWAALIPNRWNLSAYSPGILVLRSLEWAGGWLFFGISLRNRFTPSLKV